MPARPLDPACRWPPVRSIVRARHARPASPPVVAPGTTVRPPSPPCLVGKEEDANPAGMPRLRIVQTSDVHLRPDRPERRRALELVFAQAVARAADVVLIAGDLFDRAIDAQAERASVRKMVEELAPRPVIFVPGNADQDAYTASADFGANALVLAKTPYMRARIAGLEVVGVPYQAGRSLAECLTGLVCEPRHTVLIAHGTLVDAVGASFPGDGEDGAFMPIFAQDLTRRFSYAALGHLHAGDALVRREDQRLVAYAGSPVATSPRELGPRGVLVVDFEPGVGVLAHEVVPLLSPSYELVHVVCMPGGEQEAIERLAKEAAAKKAPGVRVVARLSGATTETEDTLRAAAERELERAFAGSAAVAPNAAASDLAPSAVLELAVASHPQLAQIAVVSEFVTRLTAAAKSGGIEDPQTLESALRIGLGAFVEALP